MQTTDFDLRKGYFAIRLVAKEELVVVGKVEDVHDAVSTAKKIIRDSKGQINSIRMTVPYDVVAEYLDVDLVDAQYFFNEFDNAEFESDIEYRSIGYAHLFIRESSGLFNFSFTLKHKDPTLNGKRSVLFTIPKYQPETEDAIGLDNSRHSITWI